MRTPFAMACLLIVPAIVAASPVASWKPGQTFRFITRDSEDFESQMICVVSEGPKGVLPECWSLTYYRNTGTSENAPAPFYVQVTKIEGRVLRVQQVFIVNKVPVPVIVATMLTGQRPFLPAYLLKKFTEFRHGYRALQPISGQSMTLPEKAFAELAPKGLPLEVLPWVDSFEAADATSGISLSFIKEKTDKDVTLEGLFRKDGREILWIRQRWCEGEPWWQEYERRVNGKSDLRAQLLTSRPVGGILPVTKSAADKSQAKPKSVASPTVAVWDPTINVPPNVAKENPLRLDKRTYVWVTFRWKNPPLPHLLERLKEATGLKIDVASELASHRPDYGEFSPGPKGFYAWFVMSTIARTGLEGGRWERTEDGYVLHGIPKTSSVAALGPSPGSDATALYWVIGAVGTVVLGVYFAPTVVRKLRKARPRASAEAYPREKRQGLTLIELVIVVAIIGIALGLLVSAVHHVREAANRAQCGNNLKQSALAVHAFHDAQRRMPFNQFGPFGGGPNSYAWSWLARVLPYVEQGNLYQQGNIPNTKLASSGVLDQQISLFLCPSDDAGRGPRLNAGNLTGLAVGQTNYKGVSGANWGDDLQGDGGAGFATDWPNPGTNGSADGHSNGDGIFYRLDYARSLQLAHILDGTSSTFMIGEDIPSLTWWCSWPYANNATGTCAIPPNVKKADGSAYPPWNWENNESFRSRHPGGLQFAFADGSVHFIRDSIQLSTYRALATIRGKEAVSAP